MGKTNIIQLKEFTLNDANNKNLVIKMLKYEEQLAKGDFGKMMYTNPLNNPFTSLTVEKALNRKTLQEFGFDTSDTSLNNYRSIFKTYFKSPYDYDKDIIDASYYMRNNRCVFYTSKKLNINDIMPNFELYTINNTITSIYDIINKNNVEYTIIAGFSLS